MEQEFRTTFIPKKPVIESPVSSGVPVSRPVGIIFVLSLIILLITAVIGGGIYVYQKIEIERVAQLRTEVENIQKKLDVNAVKEFTLLDKRLKNADMLLGQHLVTYPLYEILESSTLPAVRYTKLDIAFNEAKDLVVNVSGESDGYRSIALQSQALAKNPNLKNIIFSNFVVTPRGQVSFDVAFSIAKGDITYERFVRAANAEQQTTSRQTAESAAAGIVTTETGAIAEEVPVAEEVLTEEIPVEESAIDGVN